MKSFLQPTVLKIILTLALLSIGPLIFLVSTASFDADFTDAQLNMPIYAQIFGSIIGFISMPLDIVLYPLYKLLGSSTMASPVFMGLNIVVRFVYLYLFVYVIVFVFSKIKMGASQLSSAPATN